METIEPNNNLKIKMDANKIWHIIHEQKGLMSYNDLITHTGLSKQELLVAIGCLWREKRIIHFKIKKEDWMLQLIY